MTRLIFGGNVVASLTEKRRSELEYLKTLSPLETDPRASIRGILLSEQIAYYAENHQLIQPFNKENLKPAGYELTIGDEYFLGGEYNSFDGEEASNSESQKITIPPFEVAVIKTGERMCLPRFMIARWNIRVKHAYRGLLWVGGPQVDPGYKGFLFCPLYNLSDKPVTLHKGEPIALMDFAKTSDYQDGVSKKYQDLPTRPVLEDFGIDEFRSALFTKAGQKLTEFEEKVGTLEGRFITFTQISFAMFALMVAVLAVAGRLGQDSQTTLMSSVNELVAPATIFFSVWALLIVLFSYQDRRINLTLERLAAFLGRRAETIRPYVKGVRIVSLVLPLLLAFGAAAFIYFKAEPVVRDVRQQQFLVRSDLDEFGGEIDSMTADLRKQIEALQMEVDELKKQQAAN